MYLTSIWKSCKSQSQSLISIFSKRSFLHSSLWNRIKTSFFNLERSIFFCSKCAEFNREYARMRNTIPTRRAIFIRAATCIAQIKRQLTGMGAITIVSIAYFHTHTNNMISVARILRVLEEIQITTLSIGKIATLFSSCTILYIVSKHFIN